MDCCYEMEWDVRTSFGCFGYRRGPVVATDMTDEANLTFLPRARKQTEECYSTVMSLSKKLT